MRAVMSTAVKGGVDVSTLALMLAKALAEQGSSVTLVDVAGYISSIANIRVDGLSAQSVDGEKPAAGYAGKIGRIQVVKFLGDGMRLEVDGQVKATLCRCGHSFNKPFCDWTHKKVGFPGTVLRDRAIALLKPPH
jgi:CDGSH-type Zn-finger protein